jgi:hypothetical protein
LGILTGSGIAYSLPKQVLLPEPECLLNENWDFEAYFDAVRQIGRLVRDRNRVNKLTAQPDPSGVISDW